MAVPPRPSFPSSASEPALRRLGVGGSGSGGDRPLKAQIVVALVVALILIAVPLYLIRRPGAASSARAGGAPAGSMSVSAAPMAAVAIADAGINERVRLGPPQRVKCGTSPTGRGQEGGTCDGLPYFEQGLAKAIRENVDCAPKGSKSGTLNYVLTIDFTGRKLHMFPGASGSLKGPQARRAAECVQRALPPPPWDTLQHQFRFYSIAVLATYPPPGAAAKPTTNPLGTPVFE
jgi:hypothetical protein